MSNELLPFEALTIRGGIIETVAAATRKGAIKSDVYEGKDQFIAVILSELTPTGFTDKEVAGTSGTTAPDSIAGDKGAMNLPNGTEFRFAIVYSKGATTGHMLFVDFHNIEPIKPKNAPSLPNIGLGMWSFPVRSIQQVMDNAKAHGATIVSQPKKVNDPLVGKSMVATLRAPNGFLIEVFEVQP